MAPGRASPPSRRGREVVAGIATACLATLLAGCAPIQSPQQMPVSDIPDGNAERCAFLVAPFVIDLVRASASTDQALEAVAAHPGIAARRAPDGVGEQLEWLATVHQEYRLHLRYDHLSRAEVCWDESGAPSIDEALACFDEPALYALTRVQDDGSLWRLSLWYPDRGLVVDARESNEAPSNVPGALARPIECIQVVPARNLTGMAFALVPGAGGGAVYDLMQSGMLGRLKPWPGGSGALEVPD